MKNKRFTIEDRRRHIIESFVTVAKGRHYNAVKRDEVAHVASVTGATVTRHFNESMRELRVEVVKYCVENEIIEIIAQAIAIQDTAAANITQETREKVVDFVRGCK